MTKTARLFYLAIKDILFEVRTDLDDIEPFFKTRFARFFQSSATKPATASLRFETIDRSLASPDSISRQFAWERSHPLWGELKEDRFYLTDGFSLAITDLNKNECTYFVHSQTAQDKLFFYRSFILIPWLELLKNFDLFYIHASLVTKGNRGILFLGSGGSGKSTFSAAMVREGWKWVSDDNMLACMDKNGKVSLIAFEQELSLHPDLAKSMDLHRVGYLEHQKLRVAHASLPQHQLAEFSSVTSIVDLEGSTGTPSPIEKSIVFQKFIRENPTLPIHLPTFLKGVACYQSLVQQAPAVSLRADWRDIPRLTYFFSAV